MAKRLKSKDRMATKKKSGIFDSDFFWIGLCTSVFIGFLLLLRLG